MAIPYFVQCRQILKSQTLVAAARETGFQRREARKVRPEPFFWALVMSFATEPRRTLAGIARSVCLFSGVGITRQGVHKRLTERAAAFLQAVHNRLLRQVSELVDATLPPVYAMFRDIVAIDSTTIRLADRLAKLYPACRHNVRKAALKIHVCMSLTRKHAERLRITAERVHDRRGISFTRWVRDRLLLFDLGYCDYGLFGAIRRAGGTFLTRLKESANGTIVRVRRGCAKRYVGRRLNGRLYRGPVVDLDARFGQGHKSLVLRVVGIWDAGTRDYHWYVTSLKAADFPPEEVAEIYRLRWQIELLFKEWKSLCRIDQVPSGKEAIVLCLVYASLCAALLSRIVMALAARRHRLSWDSMCAPVATKILACLAAHLGIAICRGHASDLRRVLDLLTESIALYATLVHPAHVLATARRQVA